MIIINIVNSLCTRFSYIICNICLLWKAYVLIFSEIRIIIVEIVIFFLIYAFLTIIIYLSIIIINMLYMFMYLFNYIMFIIVMVMSCDIISEFTFMLYSLCKIIVTIKINNFIHFSYIVCIISVNGIMLIENNTISKIIMCCLHYAFYLSYNY